MFCEAGRASSDRQATSCRCRWNWNSRSRGSVVVGWATGYPTSIQLIQWVAAGAESSDGRTQIGNREREKISKKKPAPPPFPFHFQSVVFAPSALSRTDESWKPNAGWPTGEGRHRKLSHLAYPRAQYMLLMAVPRKPHHYFCGAP